MKLIGCKDAMILLCGDSTRKGNFWEGGGGGWCCGCLAELGRDLGGDLGENWFCLKRSE